VLILSTKNMSQLKNECFKYTILLEIKTSSWIIEGNHWTKFKEYDETFNAINVKRKIW